MKFALPMAITELPPGLGSLRASECGECHPEIYREWAGSMHAKVWTDPYYQVDFASVPRDNNGGVVSVTLTNIGADHFLPIGTPDRHLTVTSKLKRFIMWRPFIADLRDTRLVKNKPQTYSFAWKSNSIPDGGNLAISIRYHLLDEARRKKIGYRNTEPISYPLFQKNRTLPVN